MLSPRGRRGTGAARRILRSALPARHPGGRAGPVARRRRRPAESPPSWLRLVTMTKLAGLAGSSGRTCCSSRALSSRMSILRCASRLRYNPACASGWSGMRSDRRIRRQPEITTTEDIIHADRGTRPSLAGPTRPVRRGECPNSASPNPPIAPQGLSPPWIATFIAPSGHYPGDEFGNSSGKSGVNCHIHRAGRSAAVRLGPGNFAVLAMSVKQPFHRLREAFESSS